MHRLPKPVADIPHSKKKLKDRLQKSCFSKECDIARLVKIKTHYKLLNRPSPENRKILIHTRNNYSRIVSTSRNAFNKCVRNKVLSCPDGSESFLSLAINIGRNFKESKFLLLTFESNLHLPIVLALPYNISENTFKVKQVQKTLRSLVTN